MKKKVVAFSGGKDSSVMLDKLIKETKNFEKEFAVIYNDTDLEFPETRAMIPVFEDFFGIQIVRIRPPSTFEELLGRYGGYWPSGYALWCRSRLKTRPSERYYKANFPEGVVLYVGSRRAEGSRRNYLTRTTIYGKKIEHYRPILEMSTEAVFGYIADNGIPLSGLYANGWSHCGCFYCPLRGKREFLILADTHPELWQKICGWVKRYGPPPKQAWLDGLAHNLENYRF